MKYKTTTYQEFLKEYFGYKEEVIEFNIAGFPVIVDESIPKNEIHLVSGDGRIVGKITNITDDNFKDSLKEKQQCN